MKKISMKAITLTAIIILIGAVFIQAVAAPSQAPNVPAEQKAANAAKDQGSTDDEKDAPEKKQVEPLPVVGSKENFDKLMEEMYERMGMNNYYSSDRSLLVLEDAQWAFDAGTTVARAEQSVAGSGAPVPAAAAAPSATSAPAGFSDRQASEPEYTYDAANTAQADSDFSETNVQVEGVDEADVIKTDGKYIYYASFGKIWIVDASSPDNMKLVSKVESSDNNFHPTEMYVDGDTLIVVGGGWRMFMVNGIEDYRSMTRAVIYDISDRSKPEKLREIDSEGDYLSSRKIDDAVYLVTRSWLNIGWGTPRPPIIMPLYRDTVVSDEYQELGFDRMYYFPDFQSANYLFITAFELDKPEESVKVDAYLGAGDSVYASLNNLYIAAAEYNRPPVTPRISDIQIGEPQPIEVPQMSITVTDVQVLPMPTNSAAPAVAPAPEPAGSEVARIVPDTVIAPVPPIGWVRPWYAPTTTVYRFALDGGNVVYDGTGNIPGRLLNQFSMDEHNGYFRVATTDYGSDGLEINGLYVLGQDLEIVGKIDDIAPDERIYSARFMGNRAYMVTFKLVDPFFVIDLTDPTEPTVLGALKIPGYSDYLHPYDENHIIGFGKDTVEAKGIALQQGMKMSLFDVTDVTDPKEKFVVSIGDRGTDSSLLYNHKALLFDKSRNLLAFPINVAELSERQKNSQNENSIWEYGQFKFQGAYVYSIDLENGFQFQGGITHMTTQDMLRAGTYSWNYEKAVDRIIRIGENLFTTSPQMIKSTAIDGLKAIGSVNLR